MRFEWDEVKSRRNLRKHKISFETTRLVFEDPGALSVQDRVVDDEERWQTLGMIDGVIVLVAHTYREEGGEEVIRLIQPEKPLRRKGEFMKKVMRDRAKEIRALKRLKDEEIDLSDIPPAKDWNQAAVGKFYRPIKTSLTIRIDADILAWLKGQGKGYHTRINGLLREAMRRWTSR